MILGLNCAHDAAACVVSEKGIHVAIREERLSRIRYRHGFPRRALEYCNRAVGITDINKYEAIVLNQYPYLDCDWQLRQMGYRGCLFVNPSHHLLHALYAWYGSGRRELVILVVDGSGYSYGEYFRRGADYLGPEPPLADMEEAETAFAVRDGEIHVLNKRWGAWEALDPYFRFPSLGHLYSTVCQYVFGHRDAWVHAGKIMGLAPYGDASRLSIRMLAIQEDEHKYNLDWIYALPHPSESGKAIEQTPVKCDLAAVVQETIEAGMLSLVRRTLSLAPSEIVALSGGVALNSTNNGKLVDAFPHADFFITPAADDAGVAIGAALYGYRKLHGRLPKTPYCGDFHGCLYAESAILTVLQADVRVASWRRLDPLELPCRIAADLASGSIVALFDGGSEFGPRALGHRSILCDPSIPDGKERLNARVKYREQFRPYAGAVLEEHASAYFEGRCANPYMLLVRQIRKARRRDLAAVCHVDGSCRIQTVPKDYQGVLRAVLEAFYRLRNLSVLLNTSFNIRGEPIVETPAEGLDCYCASGIDILYIGPFRVEKVTLIDGDAAVVPVLNSGLTFVSQAPCTEDGFQTFRDFLRTRTGYQAPLTEAESTLLRLIDGKKDVSQIEAKSPAPHAGQVIETLRLLNLKGFIAFRRPAGQEPSPTP